MKRNAPPSPPTSNKIQKSRQHLGIDTSSERAPRGGQGLSDHHELKRGETFRVRGVPPCWTRDELRGRLAMEAAEQNDSAGVIIHSLAEETDGHSCTATVTFSSTAPQLQALQTGKY